MATQTIAAGLALVLAALVVSQQCALARRGGGNTGGPRADLRRAGPQSFMAEMVGKADLVNAVALNSPRSTARASWDRRWPACSSPASAWRPRS